MTINEVTAIKSEFALSLADGGLEVEVSAFIPDRITPPVVVIRPAPTYLRQSNLSKEFIVGVEVDLITSTASNEMAQETLDAIICSFIEALPPYAALTTIGAPFALTTGTAEYLAATATIELYTTL